MRHPDLLQSSPTPSLRLQLLSGYPLERSRNIDTPYRPYFDLVRIKILNFNLYLFLKIENKAVFTFMAVSLPSVTQASSSYLSFKPSPSGIRKTAACLGRLGLLGTLG